MNPENQPNPTGFVQVVLQRVQADNAFGAMMRRADNPNLCSAAWEYLVPYCNLAKESERLAFSLVGAAIAREKPRQDGVASFGKALRSLCKGDADALEREARRFRRVLACETIEELFPVLRPMLQYLQSQGGAPLCYQQLLKDLLRWNESVRLRWTQDFYGKESLGEKEEAM